MLQCLWFIWGDKNKTMNRLCFLLILLLLFSCAEIVPPTGGEKDILPPKIVSLYPQNGALLFVENKIDPTGLGEPPFPPVMGALANALYRATGVRQYNQPFITDKPLAG